MTAKAKPTGTQEPEAPKLVDVKISTCAAGPKGVVRKGGILRDVPADQAKTLVAEGKGEIVDAKATRVAETPEKGGSGGEKRETADAPPDRK